MSASPIIDHVFVSRHHILIVSYVWLGHLCLSRELAKGWKGKHFDRGMNVCGKMWEYWSIDLIIDGKVVKRCESTGVLDFNRAMNICGKMRVSEYCLGVLM